MTKADPEKDKPYLALPHALLVKAFLLVKNVLISLGPRVLHATAEVAIPSRWIERWKLLLWAWAWAWAMAGLGTLRVA